LAVDRERQKAAVWLLACFAIEQIDRGGILGYGHILSASIDIFETAAERLEASLAAL
jgi:hypothetical protein